MNTGLCKVCIISKKCIYLFSIMHLFLALVTPRMLNNVNTTASFNIKQMIIESGNQKMNKGTNPSIFATQLKLVHHPSMNHVRNSSVSVSHDRGK